MRRRSMPLVMASLLSLVLANEVPAKAWLPLDAADSSLLKPRVDPGADAEVISWDVHAVDQLKGSRLTQHINHHVRVKIFTPAGKESESRVDIPYGKGTRIDQIEGRTIAPDGSIVPLAEKDVYERTLLKWNKIRVKQKSFVMPAVDVGSILDYRWREVKRNPTFAGRFILQRTIPVRRVTIHLTPLDVPNLNLLFTAFNIRIKPPERESDGSYAVSVQDLPAFVEEPHMPPEGDVRSWFLFYYRVGNMNSPSEFWRDFSAALHQAEDRRLEPDRELVKITAGIVGESPDVRSPLPDLALKKVAAEVAIDVPATEAKLRRLHAFCREKIVNLESPASGLSDEQRAGLSDHKSPLTTLQDGRGTGQDINNLFGALARSMGLEAHIAHLGNREWKLFHRDLVLPGLLLSSNVAVKLGDEWRFYDPASPWEPFGGLPWQQEGIEALIPTSDGPVWATTPVSPPEHSRIVRTGRFVLRADGKLDGHARVVCTGHCAALEREALADVPPAQHVEEVRKALTEKMPSAVLSNVTLGDAGTTDSSWAYEYTLSIPWYAQATGKRLFVPTAVFQHGNVPTFTSPTRRHPIAFGYTWTEHDSLTIELPVGYDLEQPEAPGNVDLGDYGRYIVKMGTVSEGRVIVYRRSFVFGGLQFRAVEYPELKRGFDLVHERDSHTLVLRLAEKGAAAQP
jgi:hypothetical protein